MFLLISPMSLNSYAPEFLSGPAGSLLVQRYNISTQQAFREGRTDIVGEILRDYRNSGVTAPVVPIFGASPRDLNGREFTPEHRDWIAAAADLTHEIFPESKPFGSVAPILDTSDHDNEAWRNTPNQSDVARRNFVFPFEEMCDRNISRVLAEAVHDMHEATGLVLAGRETGMEEVLVSFEPTKQGLPNHANGLGSYAEVLDCLNDIGRGDVNVGIGLNCGNGLQIFEILKKESPHTFRAIYPNRAAIPHGEEGNRFRFLADKNEQRTRDEQREFDELCRIHDVTSQLRGMILLCEAKGVENISLCCGATPDDIRAIRQALITHSSSPQSPLVV